MTTTLCSVILRFCSTICDWIIYTYMYIVYRVVLFTCHLTQNICICRIFYLCEYFILQKNLRIFVVLIFFPFFLLTIIQNDIDIWFLNDNIYYFKLWKIVYQLFDYCCCVYVILPKNCWQLTSFYGVYIFFLLMIWKL